MAIVPANVGINLLTTPCTFLTLPYSEFARHAFGGTGALYALRDAMETSRDGPGSATCILAAWVAPQSMCTHLDGH